MLEALSRKSQAGGGDAALVSVTEQGQDGVIEGRGGELNGAAARSFSVCRKHSRQDLSLFGEHELLVFASIVSLLANECGDVRVVEKELIKPGKLGENLEIGVILSAEVALTALQRKAMRSYGLVQLEIPRIASDQIGQIRLEEIAKGKSFLFRGELGSGLGDDFKKRISGASGDIFLELHDERGDKIEVLVNVRKFVEQLDHPVVVLKSMHANPGQAIFAGHEVLIERLMHVPKEE